MKLKKNDKVKIIKGKDRGKTGKIERAIPNINKAIVGGMNVSKKHLKPSKKNPHGGIVDLHVPIAIANLALICPRCEKITRVGYKSSKSGKMRICNNCHELIDVI